MPSATRQSLGIGADADAAPATTAAAATATATATATAMAQDPEGNGAGLLSRVNSSASSASSSSRGAGATTFVHDDGTKVKVHIPVSFKAQERNALIKAVRAGGGVIEAHFTKGDIVIFDAEHRRAAREMLRKVDELNANEQLNADNKLFLPIVMPAWVYDSREAGFRVSYHDAKYDPRLFLERTERDEGHTSSAKVARAVANNGHVNGPRMPYTQIDMDNIVEHLAKTSATWTGLSVAREIAEKYGRHSAASYQTHLRDNIKSGRNYAKLVERYKEEHSPAETDARSGQSEEAQRREGAEEKQAEKQEGREKETDEIMEDGEEENSQRRPVAVEQAEARTVRDGGRTEDAATENRARDGQAGEEAEAAERRLEGEPTRNVKDGTALAAAAAAVAAPTRFGKEQSNELIDRLARLLARAICEGQLSLDEVDDAEDGFMRDDYATLRDQGKHAEAERRQSSNPAWFPPSWLFDDLSSAYPRHGPQDWIAFHAKNRKHLVDLALDRLILMPPEELETFASQLPSESTQEAGGDKEADDDDEEREDGRDDRRQDGEEDEGEGEREGDSRAAEEREKGVETSSDRKKPIEGERSRGGTTESASAKSKGRQTAHFGLDVTDARLRADGGGEASSSTGRRRAIVARRPESEEAGDPILRRSGNASLSRKGSVSPSSNEDHGDDSVQEGEEDEDEAEEGEEGEEEEEEEEEGGEEEEEEEDVEEDLDRIRRRRSASVRVSLGGQNQQRQPQHPRASMGSTARRTSLNASHRHQRPTPSAPSSPSNSPVKLGGGGPTSPFQRQSRGETLEERVYAFRDYYGFASVGACAHLIPGGDVEEGRTTMEGWIEDMCDRYEVAKATVLAALRNTRCNFETTELILSWYLPRKGPRASTGEGKRRRAGRRSHAMRLEGAQADEEEAEEEEKEDHGTLEAGPSKRSRKSVP